MASNINCSCHMRQCKKAIGFMQRGNPVLFHFLTSEGSLAIKSSAELDFSKAH